MDGADSPPQSQLQSRQQSDGSVASTDENGNESRRTLSPSSRSSLRPPRTFRISNSIPENTQSIDNYHLGKTIGKGNFAKVKLAEHVISGVEVAIKIIDKENLNEASLAKLDREVNIMKQLDHPNIVKLFEVIDTEDTLFLVMEYAAGGEVFDFLVEHGRMKEKVAREKFRQIVSAIEYCHGLGIIHRDLKAENLLLDADMNVKIADFGFSTFYVAGKPLDTFCGSPPYAAPELFQGKKYEGPEVDVWSLGVILYTLVSGSLPFDGSNLKELRERVLRGKYRIPFYMSTECEQLLKKFLVLVPAKRTSLRTILSAEWMNMEMEEMAPHSTPGQGEHDANILDLMAKLGFRVDNVIEAIDRGTFDNQHATFTLLERNGGKLSPEFNESSADEQDTPKQSGRRLSTGVIQASTNTSPTRLGQSITDSQSRRLSEAEVTTPPSRLQTRRATEGAILLPNRNSEDVGYGHAGEPKSPPSTVASNTGSGLRRRATDTDASNSISPPKTKSSFAKSIRRRFSRSVIVTDSSPIKMGNAQPRVLRFTFSRNNTSLKPPKVLLQDLQRVLSDNEVQYQQQEPFLLVCVHGQIHFEMEVCKLPRLAMHGIKHKRLSGQSLGYKNICTKILNELSL